MTTISNYPNGINGLLLRGVPTIIPHPGQSFWVSNADVLLNNGNSVVGVDQAGGGEYQRPFRTIDFAIGQCTANRGDVIYVMPGHVETITASGGLNLDVAGITIIGLGRGTLQPRIDYTATSSSVQINSSNVSICNVNFHANVTSVTLGVDIVASSSDTLIKGCYFDVETTATDEFSIVIDIKTGCNRTIVEDNIIDMGLGGSNTGVRLSAGISTGVVIKNNRIVGDYSAGCIATTFSGITELYIEDNLLMQGGTGNLNAVAVINNNANTTGVVRNNDIVCDVATFALQTVANGMTFIGNQRTDDIGAAKTSNDTSASVTVSTDA